MDPGSYEKGQGQLVTSYSHPNNKQSKGARTNFDAMHTTDVKPGALNVDDLVAGQCVSTDQYVSKVKD
eukprot:3698987-Ditylum_brightwellii.AAC.1